MSLSNVLSSYVLDVPTVRNKYVSGIGNIYAVTSSIYAEIENGVTETLSDSELLENKF